MAPTPVSQRWDRVGGLEISSRTTVPVEQESRTAADLGRTVVLVHGLGISSRYMIRLLRLLGSDYRVLAPDLPGIGRSSRPPRPLTVAEMAEALVVWMDVVGLDRPALLGHSLGCGIVARIADRYPTRARCLVLASPSRDPSARWAWQQAWRLMKDAPREAPSLIPIAVTDYLRAGPRRMWMTLRESMHTDAATQLSRLNHPILVVRGGRDPLVSQEWADRLCGLLTSGSVVTLPGAPHAINYTTANALANVVRPFLAAHDDPTPAANDASA